MRSRQPSSYRKCGSVLAAAAVLAAIAGGPPVRAAVQTYEMLVAPDQEAVPMTKIGDGFGDQAAGDFDPPINASLQGNGTAKFVYTGNNGNDGYYTLGIGSTFTMDMRVQAHLASLSGLGPRSMGVSSAQSTGRGIQVLLGGLRSWTATTTR